MSVAGAPLNTAIRPSTPIGLVTRALTPIKAGRAKRSDDSLAEINPTNAADGLSQDRVGRQTHKTYDFSEDVSSEEILSLVLNQILDHPVAVDLAKRLLSRFGGLGAILAAKIELLAETCKDQNQCVHFLKAIHLAMRRVLREPLEEKLVLATSTALLDYLRLTMGHERNEAVRLLFLDSRNRLLLDEEHSRGTVDHVPVYPREIVKRVLEVNATALIIVHNHPSGDPTPSNEDVSMTKLVRRVLKDVGVLLHDHVIVGRGHCESMRLLGLL